MALDFTILDEDGAPVKSVSLGVEEHSKLISDAKETEGMPVFKRLEDYYKDAEISAAELDDFSSEIWYLESINQGSSFLSALRDLIDEAQIKKVPISVIAD